MYTYFLILLKFKIHLGYQVNPLDLAPQYVPVLTGIVRLGTIGSVITLVIADNVVSSKHTTVSLYFAYNLVRK